LDFAVLGYLTGYGFALELWMDDFERVDKERESKQEIGE